MSDVIHPNTIVASRAAVLVVDMQEAFRAAIAEFDTIANRIGILVQAAKLLDVPVFATEQYSEKLGRTAPEIVKHLSPGHDIPDKTAFSCCGAPAFIQQLETSQRRQVLLCGIEAHVCVNQTAHDLIARSYQVHLLTDCVSSRRENDKQTGIAKVVHAGAIPSSLELALFEMLRDARHEHFRAVQKLIK